MSQEPIVCNCPKCGKGFKVPAELLGKKLVCKACQAQFEVKPAKSSAAPAVSGGAAAVATAAPAKPAAPPQPPSPPVAAAESHAPAPQPSSDLPSIPFDDAAVPLAGGGDADAMPTFVKPKNIEKVKIESTGHYFVVKLVLVGKMVHVGIETTLNEHAADGWRLKEILNVGAEAYAILYRDPAARSQSSKTANPPDSDTDVKTV